MVPPRQTLSVPHLGGIDVGYRLSSAHPDPSKPTLILVVPFTTTVDYYLPEFENQALTDKLNLLAIEPLGHGATRTKNENFSYWDTATMGLQLLESLGIPRAFVAGTSQGGWIAVRMALLAPQKVQGLVLLGTSMDAESPKSREFGCWDGPAAASGFIKLAGDLSPQPNFEPGDDYNAFLMDIGYGKNVDAAKKSFWANALKSHYQGDEGKRRICMAAINLATRDGLYERLPYVTCPVLWLQGTNDVVFSVANAQEGIQYFTNSPEAKLISMEGGVHFLSFTHHQELHQHLLEFTARWSRTQSRI